MTTIDAAAGGPTAADLRRREIVIAASELFDTVGYHQTSMIDIAESVGIRKPTLYHYFRTKDEILFSIHEAVIDPLLASQAERVAGGADPVEVIKGSLRDLLDLIDVRRGVVRSYYEFHRELTKDQRSVIRGKQIAFREELEAAFSTGVKQGTIRDLDPRVSILALIGAINWMHQWYGPRDAKTVDEIGEIYFDLFFTGMLT